MNKSNIKGIIILFIFFATISAVVIYFSFKEASNKNAYQELELLEDKSLFFSVSANINKFITYINENNENAVINILDKTYANNNKITINNVISKMNKDYTNSTFSPKIIYYTGYKQHFKYFVKGNLKQDIYDQNEIEKTEAYYVLNHDIEKNIYTIEIIDKNKFDKYIKSDDFEYKDITQNDNNNYIYTSMNDENMAVLYFNDFYGNVNSNPQIAFNSISGNTKNKYFPTYNDFIKKIKDNEEYKHLSITQYNVNNNIYTCKDNKGNKYIFTATGVMDYTVTIELNEE